MFFILAACVAVVFAGLFRLRGGWRPSIGRFQVPDIGTTASRIGYWAAPVGLAVFLGTGDWFLALRTVLEAWAGLVLGWGSYQDLGRMPARDDESISRAVAWVAKLLGNPTMGTEKYDMIGLTMRGALVTLPAGLDLAFMGHGFLWLFAGLAMPGIYWMAWNAPEKVRGTGIAEVVFGAWLGLTLIWSL